MSELLKPIDCVIARVVVGEDLGEEEAQSAPRGLDLFPPTMMAATTSRLEKSTREDVEKRESILSCQTASNGMDLVTSRGAGILIHGDVLGVERGGVCTNHQDTNQGRWHPKTKATNSNSDPIEG